MKTSFQAMCPVCGAFTSFAEGWKPTPAHERSRRHQMHVQAKAPAAAPPEPSAAPTYQEPATPSPGPSLVCYENLPDGSAPVRLSFSIKCF